MNFYTVRLGRRPLLEIPQTENSVRLAAVDCCPGHTFKRSVLRELVRIGFRTRLLPLLIKARPFVPRGLPENFLETWLDELGTVFGEGRVFPVIVWPGNPRRGRLYFYFLDDQGNRLAFGKLALDKFNAKKIRNEAKVLAGFGENVPKSFRVPELLSRGTCCGAEYLLTSCVPESAKAVDLGEDDDVKNAISEINTGETVWLNENPPDWWESALGACRDYPEFHSAVESAAGSGWKVCPIHGDLNRTNILRDDSSLWLIDWEQSREDGPCLVDKVCLEIDRCWNLTRLAKSDDRRECLQEMMRDNQEMGQSEIIVALAYLCSIHFTPVIPVLEGWDMSFLER